MNKTHAILTPRTLVFYLSLPLAFLWPVGLICGQYSIIDYYRAVKAQGRGEAIVYKDRTDAFISIFTPIISVIVGGLLASFLYILLLPMHLKPFSLYGFQGGFVGYILPFTDYGELSNHTSDQICLGITIVSFFIFWAVTFFLLNIISYKKSFELNKSSEKAVKLAATGRFYGFITLLLSSLGIFVVFNLDQDTRNVFERDYALIKKFFLLNLILKAVFWWIDKLTYNKNWSGISSWPDDLETKKTFNYIRNNLQNFSTYYLLAFIGLIFNSAYLIGGWDYAVIADFSPEKSPDIVANLLCIMSSIWGIHISKLLIEKKRHAIKLASIQVPIYMFLLLATSGAILDLKYLICFPVALVMWRRNEAKRYTIN